MAGIAGPNRPGRPKRGKISVPLMTDYGFGVGEDGRIIHFKADGSEEQENPLPHEKDIETFDGTLDGPVVAGGHGLNHPTEKIVVDNYDKSLKGHVGVKCTGCNIGWLVPRKVAREKYSGLKRKRSI